MILCELTTISQKRAILIQKNGKLPQILIVGTVNALSGDPYLVFYLAVLFNFTNSSSEKSPTKKRMINYNS